MKPARAHKLSKRDRKRAGKQASKNPAWMNDVASSLHWSRPPGFSRGAASPVRHIVKDGHSVSPEIASPTPEAS